MNIKSIFSVAAIIFCSCAHTNHEDTSQIVEISCGASYAHVSDDHLKFDVQVYTRTNRPKNLLYDSDEISAFDIDYDTNLLVRLPQFISPSRIHADRISVNSTLRLVRVPIPEEFILLSTNAPASTKLRIRYNAEGLQSNIIECDVPIYYAVKHDRTTNRPQ